MGRPTWRQPGARIFLRIGYAVLTGVANLRVS